MKHFTLEITYQPINKCWGVNLKKENVYHNVVDENLTIALAEMAKFIERYDLSYGN